ncbi:MAG: modification methylase [Deltaproteobacteria bacterium CG_4_10_14_0_2_um_filter_43_8]|nr:MAG: modification methylase [Deltaproteobacteria bacterium CG_4_10_14_0_2_um_filter_43_8]
MDKKSSNKNLRKASQAKQDEFYTQLTDIENELKHYKDQFRGKVVFCNCDDPKESNFVKYFSMNFEHLGLKKLIATHYKEANLFTHEPPYKLEYTGDKNGNRMPDPNEFMKEMIGTGDFRSPECIKLLKEADIVVTNPPFSLFREYVAQLVKFDKKFLIMGNQNAITYKEIFKLIKDDKMWLGQSLNGRNILFQIPDYYESYYKIIDGKKYAFPKGVVWFTNLDVPKRSEEMVLYKKYSKEEYPTYDNYDAINVDRTEQIPLDYAGVMGVPITFLHKYNPEQFEIIGQGQGNLYRELSSDGLSGKFVENYYKTGGTGSIKEDHPVLGYYNKNGKATIPYMRILIKNKKL